MKINLINYFEETIKKVPEKIAVQEGKTSISFQEIADRSKKLSLIIKNSSNRCIRKPVAVYLDKNINSIISDLAIAYSGNFYMNLDTKTPINRIRNIWDLIEPALLITDNKHIMDFKDMLDESKIINIESIDYKSILYKEEEITELLDNIIDTDPLCIINTSGSTGIPKGVVLNHRSFIDFTEWAINSFDISENEIIGSLSPSVFDIYSFELCMLMAKGSTILILPENIAAFPVRILQLLTEHKVTFIFWVPTIMVNIANMNLLEEFPLPDLKIVWFAGEVFPTKQFNQWRSRIPHSIFANLYGPIEITLDCTYYIIDRKLRDDEPIPIGNACRNTDILILNDSDNVVGISEEGELCVRGGSLAMGYYNNPEKTALAFVQNPLNKSYPEIIYRTGDIALINNRGEIIFKGRNDTLVKHSGYRIELAEIEHIIINTLKLVKNACVIYNYDKKEIILYYEDANDLSISEMRKQISTVLPKYMIPRVFIKVDELPKNVNGKIDRLKLKEMSK